jgi:hypothetical protein
MLQNCLFVTSYCLFALQEARKLGPRAGISNLRHFLFRQIPWIFHPTLNCGTLDYRHRSAVLPMFSPFALRSPAFISFYGVFCNCVYLLIEIALVFILSLLRRVHSELIPFQLDLNDRHLHDE